MNEHSLIYMTNLYENAMDMNTKLQEELENLKNTNEEHRVLNGELREELEFEKTTNKELLSTGAELENKLYEEQDKNKRLNNIINELEKELNKDFNTYMTGNRQNGKIYKAGANNYRMHIYLRLKELKGSDKEWQ